MKKYAIIFDTGEKTYPQYLTRGYEKKSSNNRGNDYSAEQKNGYTEYTSYTTARTQGRNYPQLYTLEEAQRLMKFRKDYIMKRIAGLDEMSARHLLYPGTTMFLIKETKLKKFLDDRWNAIKDPNFI